MLALATSNYEAFNGDLQSTLKLGAYVAYRNLVTKEQYSVESVQEEIKAENRVGTLEQLDEYILNTEKAISCYKKDTSQKR